MKEKKLCLVVTFYTTAEAMALESRCKQAGICGKLFSAPRALSADCGIAWQSPAEMKENLVRELDASGIEIHGLHEMMV